ncbi:ATP-binding protein [Nitrosomonas sp.]|uniref:ATP-binding protein n=1 Tax=Nitrosomonas sp. TaxID=42353 RepID=UPI0025D7B894|nr:ATP-binding protein [Nitrosomonas sp.]
MDLIINAIISGLTSAATKDLYDKLKKLLFKKDTTGNLPNVLSDIEKKAKGGETKDEKDLIALLIEAFRKSDIDFNDSELNDVANKIIGIKIIISPENPPPARIHIYNYRWGNNNNKKSEPYHLETFQPNDEELFNTRGIFIDTVDSICVKINEHESNFITLEGESGSGKSSLVLAGLVPRLAKEGNWKFIYIKFNEDPYQELAAGLVAIKKDINDPITTNPNDIDQLSLDIKANEKELKNYFQDIKNKNSGTRILLIADQLDSLYTKCTQEVRTHFLTLLKNSLPKENSDSIVLIATFDSSFFQKDGNNDQDYKNIIGKDVKKIPTLQPEILKKLITEPASKEEVEFDEYVVGKIR